MSSPVRLMRTLACMALVGGCLAAGCATPYQPLTAWSYRGGYVDQQLPQDTFFVEFYGNGYTDAHTAGNYLLYRCAELADQAGAEYFLAIGGDPSGRSHLHIDIVHAYPVMFPIPVYRPFAAVYVRLLHEPPSDPKQRFFKTKDVLESLRSKVNAR